MQKQCNNDPVRRRFNPQITHIYHSFTVVTVSVTMVWDKYVKGVMEYNYIILLIILSVDVDL